MSTQNIMWTALPNGFTLAGNQLRLSVLVSPRLVTNTATGTLDEFPAFLDWPATVAGLSFRVEFQGGPTVPATPVTEPGNPALDSAAWRALFDGTISVNAYAFDDRSDLAVRSFPVKKVFSFLTNAYQTIAVQSAQQKPNLAQLGFVPGAPGVVPFNQIAIYSDEQAGLEERLNVLLSRLKAVPANFGTPQTDFLQVRLMHQFLSKVVLDADGNRVPLPPQQLPDIDLHNAVAGLGQYTKLMRALGLAIDLEVPLSGVPAASNVRVHPSLPGTPPMIPWTAYTPRYRQETFCRSPHRYLGCDRWHAAAFRTGSVRRRRTGHRRGGRKGAGFFLQFGTVGVRRREDLDRYADHLRPAIAPIGRVLRGTRRPRNPAGEHLHHGQQQQRCDHRQPAELDFCAARRRYHSRLPHRCLEFDERPMGLAVPARRHL
jgi:hypothetical protein